MAKSKPVGVHGTDSETKRDRSGTSVVGRKEADINQADFEEKAKALNLGNALANRFADPKSFKSGSYGFFLNDKITIEIDGKPVKLQANIVLTVANSKPKEEEVTE